MANRLFWSVTATAGMPAAATAATSSGTRTTLSTSEYSVCRRRCTKLCDISGGLILETQHRQEVRVIVLVAQAADWTEGTAMLLRGSVLALRREVRGCAVALV